MRTCRPRRGDVTAPPQAVLLSGEPIAAFPTTDPRDAGHPPRNRLEHALVATLRDPRDLVLLRTAALLATVTVGHAVAVYARWIPLWLGVFTTVGLLGAFAGKYTLMLHVLTHRSLFRREYKRFEPLVTTPTGVFFGHTPNSFHAHHIGMHHPEENLPDDLSTTLFSRRDSLVAFLRYWATFFFRGPRDLARYFRVRNRTKLLRSYVRGELSWLALVVVLGLFDPGATAVVLVLPFVLMRFMLMAGNFAQHAFVDLDDPGNPYRHSTCLVNSVHNRRCFNDGYHIVHHLHPAMHWTEMPGWFEAHLPEFGRQDAIVFDGVADNLAVWWWLMTGNYDRMARHLVSLPGAPERDHPEKVAFLRNRVRRVEPARVAVPPLAA